MKKRVKLYGIKEAKPKRVKQSRHTIPVYSLEQWKEMIYQYKNIKILADKFKESSSTLAQVISAQTGKRFGQLFIDILAERKELPDTIYHLYQTCQNKKFIVAAAKYFGIRLNDLVIYLDDKYPLWRSWTKTEPVQASTDFAASSFLIFSQPPSPLVVEINNDEQLYKAFGLT